MSLVLTAVCTLKELRLEEEEEYKTFLRMTPKYFDEHLRLVEFDIQKQNTQFRPHKNLSLFREMKLKK